TTRKLQQKSLRKYARDDYDQSTLNSNIFDELPYNRFKNIILRNSGNDNDSTLLRDGLMHELVKDLDVDVQGYQPAIILINGEYWGIQNIRERLNRHYLKTKYNIDKEDLSLLKISDAGDLIQYNLQEGSQADKNDYLTLLNYVEENDMTQSEHIEYIENHIYLNNHLHYVAYQIYYVNTDSFFNNQSMWRKNGPKDNSAPHGHDGKWRWMLFDLDWGMGYGLYKVDGNDPITYNMVSHILSENEEMTLIRNLMKNERVQ